jgi:hypothetical protein
MDRPGTVDPKFRLASPGATIVVAGALANKCWNGGNAWVPISWALGFRKLGFRVLFIEQIASETLRNYDLLGERQVIRLLRGDQYRLALYGRSGLTAQHAGQGGPELRPVKGHTDRKVPLLVRQGGGLELAASNRDRGKGLVGHPRLAGNLQRSEPEHRSRSAVCDDDTVWFSLNPGGQYDEREHEREE